MIGLMHITCCDDWSLCEQDMTTEERRDALREREEWCLTCLRQDNAGAPCSHRLCPLRPRSERFGYLWRRQQRLRAVRQLLSWRKR